MFSSVRFPKSVLALSSCLCLSSVFPGALAVPLLTVTPSSITNDYGGSITLQITGLATGGAITLEKFLDTNSNGAVDAGEDIVQRFRVTDGQITAIGGVRNVSVPGDDDGAANGQIRVVVSYLFDDEIGRFGAPFVYRATGASGTDAKPFRVVTRPFSQGIQGVLRSNGVAVSGMVGVFTTDEDDDDDFIGGVITDTAGNFAIDTPPGEFRVLALKKGMISSFVTAPIVTVAPNQRLSTDLTISVLPDRTISGRIIDSTSEPVPPLTLFVESVEGEVTIGFTGVDGRFSLPVRSGFWEFNVEADSFGLAGLIIWDEDIEVDATAGSVTVPDAVLPKGTALLYGNVKDEQGRAIAGVRLGVSGQNGSFDVHTASNHEGAYGAALIDGQWHLRFRDENPALEGYVAPYLDSVSISAGQTVRKDIIVRTATSQISGSLRNNTNGPVANVWIQAFATIDGKSYKVETDTDASGNFSLGVIDGTWEVRGDSFDLSEQGYAGSTEATVTVLGEDENVSLVAIGFSAYLSGRAVDDSGNPVAFIQIEARQDSGPSSHDETDGDGKFQLGVTEGNWFLQLNWDDSRERGYLAPSLSFQVTDGVNISNIVYRLKAATSTIDVFVHTTNGTPVSGIGSYGWANVGGVFYYVNGEWTDSSGHSQMQVFDGIWQVELANWDLNRAGFANADGLSLTVSGTRTAEFVVRPFSSSLRGRVVDDTGAPVSRIDIGAVPNNGGGSFVTTGDDGSFAIGVGPGQWNLQLGGGSNGAEARGLIGPYLPFTVQEGVDHNDILVVAQRVTRSVSIAVRDNQGNGVSGVGVYSYTMLNGTNYSSNPDRTDGSGTVPLPVFPGSWTVGLYDLDRLGYAPVPNKTVTIPGVTEPVVFVVGVGQTFQISTADLPPARQGIPYSFQLQAEGGEPPYQDWHIDSPAFLPPGLTLADNGWINGTPQAAGDFPVGIAVMDSSFRTARRDFVLVVEAGEPSGVWSTKAPMPTARLAPAAGVINGLLYVVGGSPSASEVYDPIRNTWSTVANMPNPRARAAAGVIDGKLYVAGGCCGNEAGAALDVYDPVANTWTSLRPMSVSRNAAAAGVINGKLYIVGGTSDFTSTLEVYDPVSNTWTVRAPMPTPRWLLAAGVIDGMLYAVGGANSVTGGPNLPTLEIYDPESDYWWTDTPMPTPRADLGAAVLEGKLYVAGGFTGDHQQFESYDPNTGEWTIEPAMPTARGDLALAVVGNELFAVGGTSNPGEANLAVLEQFSINDANTTTDIVLKSDGNTLAASLGAGAPTSAILNRLNSGDVSELAFVPAWVGAFGTGTPLPPGAPWGTEVINLPPGNGQNGFFKVAFTLPESFSAIQLVGMANVDDFGRAFLNGTPITSPLLINDSGRITQFGNAVVAASDPALFRAGVNELILADLNAGGGPSGAAFYAIVSYEAGTQVSSPTLSGPSISNGTFSVAINGAVGQTYAIDVSTDLKGWTEVGTVNLTSESQRVTDPDPTTLRQRFYRVRVAP